MTSIYFYFPEGKGVSGVLHGKSVRIPCILCTSLMEGSEGLVHRTERTLHMTADVRLAVTKLKVGPGECSQAEVSEAVQQNLRTHSISS